MIPKKNLRWFLFEENIDLHVNNGLINYEGRVLSHMEKFISYYPFLRLFGIKSQLFYSLSQLFSKEKSNILVHDYLWKYPSIVKQLKLNYNTIFFGLNIKPFIFSCHKNVHYPLYNVYNSMYNGIIKPKPDLLEDSYLNLKKVLKRINPKFILLDFDHFPETRLMTLVAKDLEIPTIEIQHGIYSKGKLFSGYYVDYVFVWGEYFKNLYLESKIKEDQKICILGYPYDIHVQENMKYDKKIVFLGQPFELYGDSFLEQKIDVVKNLDGLCRGNGFEFVYKPHRMEDLDLLKRELPHVEFYSKTEKIKDTIKKNDIFISFNSTALIEAALNSRICLQLNIFNLNTDDFEKIGICRSFTNLSEFDDFLKDVSSADDLKRFYYPVNSNFIEIPLPNPGEKLVDIIKHIL